MQTSTSNSERQNLNFSGLSRRFREYALIFRDPVLFMSLLFSGIFIFVFVIMPIFQTVSGGFFSKDGTWDLTYFARYFDDYYGPSLRRSFLDTMTMGLLTAIFGTIVGFIFAYASVRCNPPGKGLMHWLALLPTVSPPFALALSMILLFGRNGLISKKLLGITFVQGMNDVKKVLVGCDFSPDSSLAFEYGLRLAQEFQAELHLAHVVEPPLYDDMIKPSESREPFRQRLRKTVQERLTAMVPEEARTWCNPVTTLLAGQPHEELIKYAVVNDMDLVVLGVRGHSLVETLLVGSTTGRVMRGAPCPVLSVQPKAHVR